MIRVDVDTKNAVVFWRGFHAVELAGGVEVLYVMSWGERYQYWKRGMDSKELMLIGTSEKISKLVSKITNEYVAIRVEYEPNKFAWRVYAVPDRKSVVEVLAQIEAEENAK
jgi:hypothetical protein